MDKQVLRSITESNIRLLVQSANKAGIKQSQIVEVISSKEQYTLLYYG